MVTTVTAVVAPIGTAAVAPTTDALDASPAPVDHRLRTGPNVTTVVVRLAPTPPPSVDGREATIEALERQRKATQQPVVRFADRTEGVTVVTRLWLVDAVLLRVDTNQVDLDRVARIRTVSRLHANFEVSVPDTSVASEPDAASPPGSAHEGSAATPRTDGFDETIETETTYGLAQVSAPSVWAAYGTRGEGVTVAVLDTGVDVSHPDIDLYTRNESDPTYPGGWAEFDENGERVPDSRPRDTDRHGTHTTGTVSGGNASGEWIGVAPNVRQLHGLVLPDGRGTFAQLVAGMQWAVRQNADVISMSLGTSGPAAAFVEPVRNARAAGTIVVASIGNGGPGTSGSPGNVFEAVGVGATNRTEAVAEFSGGGVIDTDTDWGSDAPDDWPDSYVVPDVVAPGVAVKSAVPGGDYLRLNGTSMAAPHVAGVIALELSAVDGNASAPAVERALLRTARDPDAVADAPNTRYGAGIVDAKRATDRLTPDRGVTGVVTDRDGTPIESATVTTDTGTATVTDATGRYELPADPGRLRLTVDAFGARPRNATVVVPESGFVTRNVTLDSALGLRVATDQPADVQAGTNLTTTLQIANAESIAVTPGGDYDPADATLFVDGRPAEFGAPVDLDDSTNGSVTVSVHTANETAGNLSLEHTVTGLNDSATVTTGPTTVYANPITVGVVDTFDGQFGDQVAGALERRLGDRYRVGVVPTDILLADLDTYDVFVVQRFPPDNRSLIRAFVTATQGPATGVVYLDGWGFETWDWTNGILGKSIVTGDPATVHDDDTGSIDPQFVDVAADHPIFDGVDTSQPITVHEATYPDLAWFENTSATVIASVTNEPDAVSGPAIAVDPENRTVLAATLGRELFVQNPAFTAAADTILANAVEYATPKTTTESESLRVSDATVGPNGTATVHLNATADGVAAARVTLTYDPGNVKVTAVRAGDLGNPDVVLDRDRGRIRIATAGATPVDGPTLAELSIQVTPTAANSTTIGLLANESSIVDGNWTPIPVTYHDGTVTVPPTNATTDAIRPIQFRSNPHSRISRVFR